MPRLQTRGLDPAKSPILKQVDPAEMASVLKALDQMSRKPDSDTAKVMRAAENAVHVGALPEVRALMESGRLVNPEVLSEKLRNLTYEFEPDPSAPRRPPGADLLAWQDAVLTAGERHRILRILAAPAGDCRRDSDGPLQRWIPRHGDRIEPEPPFPAGFLLGTAGCTTATLLAYATPTGIVEDWFTDVADLAEAAGLQPPRHTGYEPLLLAVVGWNDGSATASLGTATDIWFPRAGVDQLDNRVLASRNAPRLNAFLTELRAASAAIGGTWRWSPTRNQRVEAGLIAL